MKTFQPLSHNEREAARVALRVCLQVVEGTRTPPEPATAVELHVRALNALSLAIASGLAPMPAKVEPPECGAQPTIEQLDSLLETAWTCAHRLRAAAEVVYLRLEKHGYLVAELAEALDENAKEGM